MKLKPKYFHFIILSFVIGLGCDSISIDQRIKNIENGLVPSVVIEGQPIEKMNLQERMEHYKVPGVSIAFIDDHKISWTKVYGVVDKENGKLITPETRFQAASISKPVAAMAALKLVQDGKLNLTENVNNKLTSWKVPDNEFTQNKKVNLQGLLNHSAGLTVHGFRGYAKVEPVPTLVQLLNGEKPANSDPIRVDISPDAIHRYSGGGYSVMQQLLIDIESKQFPEILKELVLDPIGMNYSTYEQPLPENLWTEAVTGYRRNEEEVKGKWHTYPEMAAAGLWTTPSDLAKFAIEIMLSLEENSNKVLSKAMTERMLTKVHGKYGLGLGIERDENTFTFGHGGSNEGFKCNMTAFPIKGQGVVIMTNGDRGGELYSEIIKSIDNEYGWNAYKPQI